MSLPPPTLSVPTLVADGAFFQGVTFGPGTPYGISKLEGLDLPDIRSGNTDRPRTRGAFVGANLLKTRQPTMTLDVGPQGSNYGGYGSLRAALQALTSACSNEGTTEYPLWVQLPGWPLVCAMSRVMKKSIPYDVTADLGGLVKGATIQWEATDPYFYSAPTQTATVGLPTPTTGLKFNLTFPLSFGGGTTPNQVTVNNSGDVPCWPVLIIQGPCVNPSVSNLSIAGSPTIQFDIQLFAGDLLVVDCDQQSITYTPSGQTVAAAYNQVLQSGSTFFSITPGGPNVVSFNSQDTSAAAGTLTVWFASAYDGLT